MFEFFARHGGRVQKGASVLAAIQNLLFVEPVERRHQRGVSNALFEGEIDFAHGDFATLPRLLEDFAFEFSQRQRGDFARPAEATQ